MEKDYLGVFYSRFVMRDFFGKSMPGFIAIALVAVPLLGVNGISKLSSSLGFFGGVFLLGLSWVVGVLFQAQGELDFSCCHESEPCRISEVGKGIDYIPKNKKREDWDRIYLRARLKHPTLVGEHERLVALMECCGIGASVARRIWLFSLLAYLIHVLYTRASLNQWNSEGLQKEFAGAVALGILLFIVFHAGKRLQFFHECHRYRHYKLALNLISLKGKPEADRGNGK